MNSELWPDHLIDCPRHGRALVQTACSHLIENGGDYVPLGQTTEGLTGLYLCPGCFDLGPSGPFPLQVLCMHCVREDLAPKLGDPLNSAEKWARHKLPHLKHKI